MYSPEDLKIQAQQIQDFMESEMPEDPHFLIDRLGNLSSIVAKTAKLLADAKYYQDTLINGAIMDSLKKAYEEKLSPSTINKFVTTAAKEQNYLVNWIDRLNSAAVHQLDGIRSIVSYKKAEMVM